MMLAPHVDLHGSLVRVANGMGGITTTVRKMRALVNEAKTDPKIIQAAVSAIFTTAQHDERAEAAALLSAVQDGIRYVKDVHGVETLATPQLTLLRRVGDCDDQATLLAALLESVGYPTRFVVAGYGIPPLPEHVYLQTFVAGMWLDADPTENFTLGTEPPDPTVLYVEGLNL